MDELNIAIATTEKDLRQLCELSREYHAKAENYSTLARIISETIENKRGELAKYEAMQNKRERG